MKSPAKGDVSYDGKATSGVRRTDERELMKRKFGTLFQERRALEFDDPDRERRLAVEAIYESERCGNFRGLFVQTCPWSGWRGLKTIIPNEISGGMKKRAGLARAMAMDPEILFFDEPSAGLDPISAKLLDDLILELRDSLGTTVVVVTHELASIFAIGNELGFPGSGYQNPAWRPAIPGIAGSSSELRRAEFPPARPGRAGERRGMSKQSNPTLIGAFRYWRCCPARDCGGTVWRRRAAGAEDAYRQLLRRVR